jgi:hypothetical protein
MLKSKTCLKTEIEHTPRSANGVQCTYLTVFLGLTDAGEGVRTLSG